MHDFVQSVKLTKIKKTHYSVWHYVSAMTMTTVCFSCICRSRMQDGNNYCSSLRALCRLPTRPSSFRFACPHLSDILVSQTITSDVEQELCIGSTRRSASKLVSLLITYKFVYTVLRTRCCKIGHRRILILLRCTASGFQ